MEPALTLAILSAGVLGASLVVDLTGSAVAALSRMGPRSRWRVTPPLARLLAGVFVMSALLRMGHVGAVTPPPMHRIERSHPSPNVPVDGETLDVSVGRAPMPSAPAVSHVVAKGECLWRIARGHLVAQGMLVTGAEVSRLWRAIYAENRAVIGDDPDLILPGQILTIPGDPDGT